MSQQALTQEHGRLLIDTSGPGFTNLTAKLRGWLADTGAGNGVLTVFLRHTSASLTIQENADPDVLADLSVVLDRLASESAGYRHDIEGPDDMPAHIKSMLTQTSLTIPVLAGDLTLGTWQAVYLIEHRRAPHRREAVLHFLGTTR